MVETVIILRCLLKLKMYSFTRYLLHIFVNFKQNCICLFNYKLITINDVFKKKERRNLKLIGFIHFEYFSLEKKKDINNSVVGKYTKYCNVIYSVTCCRYVINYVINDFVCLHLS